MDEPQGAVSSIGTSTLVERVAGLSEVVAARRGRFDSDGRLPDDLVRELAALGLFRLWLPAALGGLELSALEFMDVVEAAAALDGTIGWLAGNGGGMSRVGAFVSAESAREIFSDPDAFVVSATGALGRAVRVPGGYSVTGRWPFGSGSPHGTWFCPICEIDDDGTTGELIFVLAPRNDVVLHDNWQVSGLCATGSVDFEFRDVFVADDFTFRFQPEPRQPGTLYRLPTRSIFTFTVATVPLGIANGAIDDFVTLAGAGKRSGDSAPLGERELIQSQLGQIDARVSASRAYLRHTMTVLLEAVETDGDLEAPRVDYRLACTFASQSALWAIGQLTEMAGAVSIKQSFPLERRERDARAAAKHIAMGSHIYAIAGRHLLGHDLTNVGF